jgi:hypothetical protein
VLFDTYHLAYTIGLLYAPLIARHSVFFWNGWVFVNKIKFPEALRDDEGRQASVIAMSMADAVARKAAADIGAKKLGEIYRALSASARDEEGFRKLLTFVLLVRAKPRHWSSAAEGIIASTDRKSIYMRSILFAALRQFHLEINTILEREELKRLVALIRAKRDLKKNNVGAKLVSRVLRRLENVEYFEGTKTDR